MALDGGLTGLLGKPLVRQPVSKAIGEPLGVEQVARRVPLRAAREQRQHANHLIVDPDGNLEAGPHAVFRSGYAFEQLRLDTLEEARCRLGRDSLQRPIGRSGVQVRCSVIAQQDELDLVIRDDPGDDRGQVLNEVTDVMFQRERRQQVFDQG